jgi:hypothetical protein
VYVAFLAQHLRHLADGDEQQQGEEEADVSKHNKIACCLFLFGALLLSQTTPVPMLAFLGARPV